MKTIQHKMLAICLGLLTFSLPAKENLPAKWDADSKAVYDLLVAQMQSAGADYSRSVDTLVKFARSQKDDRLYGKAFKALLQTQRYEEAIEIATIWQESQKNDIELDKYIILALALNGDIEQAVNKADKMVMTDGVVDDRALLELASLLVGQWYAPNVSKLIERLYADYGDNEMLAFTYAKQQRWQGHTEKAINALDKLIFKSPKNLDWLQEKSDIYRYALQLDKAENVWTALLSDYPNNARFQFAYAQFLYDRYDYKRAETILNGIDAQDELKIPVNMLSMMTKIQLGEYQKAEAVIDWEKPDKTFAKADLTRLRYNLADYLLESGQDQQAKKHFQAIEKDEQYAEPAAMKIGQIRYQESLEEGDKWFAQFAKDFHTSESELVQIKATALQDAKREEIAHQRLNKYLQKHPKNEKIRYLNALIAADMHRDQAAINDLQTLYATTPENIDYQNALGYTLLSTADGDKEKLAEAKSMIAKALFAKPSSPAIVDSMGWVLYQQEKYNDALPYFRYAYAHFLDGEIVGHYIIALAKAGKIDQARKLYQLEKHYAPSKDKINFYTKSIQSELND